MNQFKLSIVLLVLDQRNLSAHEHFVQKHICKLHRGEGPMSPHMWGNATLPKACAPHSSYHPLHATLHISLCPCNALGAPQTQPIHGHIDKGLMHFWSGWWQIRKRSVIEKANQVYTRTPTNGALDYEILLHCTCCKMRSRIAANYEQCLALPIWLCLQTHYLAKHSL